MICIYFQYFKIFSLIQKPPIGAKIVLKSLIKITIYFLQVKAIDPIIATIHDQLTDIPIRLEQLQEADDNILLR